MANERGIAPGPLTGAGGQSADGSAMPLIGALADEDEMDLRSIAPGGLPGDGQAAQGPNETEFVEEPPYWGTWGF